MASEIQQSHHNPESGKALLTLAGKFVQNRQPTWVQMRYQSEVIRLMQ
jgi:hypothetical protein